MWALERSNSEPPANAKAQVKQPVEVYLFIIFSQVRQPVDVYLIIIFSQVRQPVDVYLFIIFSQVKQPVEVYLFIIFSPVCSLHLEMVRQVGALAAVLPNGRLRQKLDVPSRCQDRGELQSCGEALIFLGGACDHEAAKSDIEAKSQDEVPHLSIHILGES